MSGHCWRISSTSSSDSSRERMTRDNPIVCQNFTAAQFTVFDCAGGFRHVGQRSRTIANQAGVGHDQRVWLHVDHRCHVVG